MKRKTSNYLLAAVLVLMPYNFVGEGFGGLVIVLAGGMFLILDHNKNKAHNVNKKYVYLLIGLLLTAVFSMVFSKDILSSLEGLSIYISAVLFYKIFRDKKEEEKEIIRDIVYLICISAVVFIIYEGIILNKRVGGNFNYPNTYGLSLIIGLYFNSILDNKSISWAIESILILGIIYTGSRNSMLYLIIYLFLHVFYNFKQYGFTTLISVFMSLLIYICLSKLGIGALFLIPIFIYIVYYVFKSKKFKVKNYGVLIIGIISIALILGVKNNYITRLKNISFYTPVLQERLVYFEDGIKSILKNPLGHGINSFEYRQYTEQSAFYDVRYIHNSVLQRGYDIGILGMIIFIAIGIYGTYVLFKSENKDKKYYLPLHLSIFFHSLLDFDFEYPAIFIFVVMIFSFGEENLKYDMTKGRDEKKFKGKLKGNASASKAGLAPRVTYVFIIIFSFYLILINSIDFIGSRYDVNKDYNMAIRAYDLERKITIKTPRPYLALSQVYNEIYMEYGEKSYLKKCIDCLKEGEKINPYDPRIKGNLAFSYEKLKDNKNAVKYYEEFLTIQRFYPDMYEVYYNFLISQYKVMDNDMYKTKIESLKQLYEKNYKELNPKARFMKNQLKIDKKLGLKN